MVKIRLRREGKKQYPVYKLVVTDRRSPRDGTYLEAVGQYNPNLHPIAFSVKEDRLEHWLRRGAQPTDTVRSLLKRSGFWLRWTLVRQGKDEAVVKSVLEQWLMQQAERSKREEDRKARRAVKKKQSHKSAEAAPATPAPTAASPATA